VQTDPNGLLYMRARYYNPYICRFINPDPSGFKGGLNFYQFADGNPISEIDPFGLGAVGDNDVTSWITSGAIGTAGVLEQAGQVRDNYNAFVSQLQATGQFSSDRAAAQVFFNQPANSTTLSQGVTEMYNWERGYVPGVTTSLANPTVTSAAINNAAAWATWGGRSVMVVGVAADAYQVSTAPNPSLALVQVSGATIGGVGGASAGATIGGAIGTLFGPGPGTAIGALIGGMLGGTGGGAGGAYLGGAAYQSVNGFGH
jgi:RHS repeat-associated protein